jgi:membrane-bound inhibitor of C-type lysozyme
MAYDPWFLRRCVPLYSQKPDSRSDQRSTAPSWYAACVYVITWSKGGKGVLAGGVKERERLAQVTT